MQAQLGPKAPSWAHLDGSRSSQPPAGPQAASVEARVIRHRRLVGGRSEEERAVYVIFTGVVGKGLRGITILLVLLDWMYLVDGNSIGGNIGNALRR